MCEGKLAQNHLMALKGTEFSSVETPSLVSLWGGPEDQSLVYIFLGGGQASVENRLKYVENNMCQGSLLTCLNSQARGLLTLGHLLPLSNGPYHPDA